MHTKKSKIWTGLFTLLLVLGIIFPMLGALKQISAAVETPPKVSIHVANTAANYKLHAYKLLSASKDENGKYTYTVNENYKTILATVLNITGVSNGATVEDQILAKLATYKKDTNGSYDTFRPIADKIYKAIAADSTITADKTVDESPGNDGTTISDLDPGYYLIAETYHPTESEQSPKPVSLVMVETAVDTEAATEVTLKRDREPGVTKQIREVDDHESADVNEKAEENDTAGSGTTKVKWKVAADFDKEETIPFRLTATLPSDYVSFTTYALTLHDKLSKALNYEASSAKVYLVKGSVSADDLSKVKTLDGVTKVAGSATQNVFPLSTGYSVDNDSTKYGKTVTNNSGEEFLNVAFTDVKAVTYDTNKHPEAKDHIVVEYNATFDDTNNYANVLFTKKGNLNSVYAEYSRDPYNADDKGKTPDKYAVAFTFKTIVNKVDGAGNALEGATFTLSKLTKGTVGGTGTSEPTWTTVKTIASSELQAGSKSVFNFTGLDAGTYKLEETVVPTDYNKAADVIFKLVPGYATSISDSDNNITALAVTDASGAALTDGTPPTFTVDLTKLEATTNVVNNSGKQLPSTGGMGTVLLYTAGAILAVGAGVYLIVKRRTTVK